MYKSGKLSEKSIYIHPRDLNICNTVGVCAMTREQFVDLVFELPAEPVSATVDLIGVPAIVSAKADPKVAEVYNHATVAAIDGMPFVKKARRQGLPAERCSGPDIMGMVFTEGIKRGATHYFYGGKNDEVLSRLKCNLERDYPGINIVGMYSPPFRPLTEEEDVAVCNEINRLKPDFVWVGIGAPKQEIWMYEHQTKLHGVKMFGVGAGFDFIAGSLAKAPEWMENASIEWLYRLIKEPKRLWRRYIIGGFKYLLYSAQSLGKGERIVRGLRIAQVGHKRIPSREGGVEIVVGNLAPGLAARGNRVDAYNRSGYHVSGKEFDTKHSRYYKGVRIITIPTFQNAKLNAIVYSFLATIRVLFTRYDIYHYHAEGPCFFLGLLKLFGKHIVVTIHGLDWQRSKWGGFATWILKRGERAAVKYADEIIVLSRNMQQYFRDTYGRETVYIPNGIDRPKLQTADEMTTKWGIEADKYILFLARLVPEKGLHYLIEAYKQLDTDLKLVIAGGGSHAAEYVEHIHRMADGDNNIIFTNFVQGKKLEELFSNAHIFVLPSDVEGMAIGLLEAMSYGNCCLVSDIPENTEVVGNHAEIFHKSDVNDLKDKLQYLIDNPDVVSKYSSEAADYICNTYSWDKVVDATYEIYNKVL